MTTDFQATLSAVEEITRLRADLSIIATALLREFTIEYDEHPSEWGGNTTDSYNEFVDKVNALLSEPALSRAKIDFGVAFKVTVDYKAFDRNEAAVAQMRRLVDEALLAFSSTDVSIIEVTTEEVDG